MFFGQHWLVVSVMLSWDDNLNPVVCTMVGSSAPRENASPPQVFTNKRETFSKCISWTAINAGINGRECKALILMLLVLHRDAGMI